LGVRAFSDQRLSLGGALGHVHMLAHLLTYKHIYMHRSCMLRHVVMHACRKAHLLTYVHDLVFGIRV
jgi:hypothetical protein